MESRGVVESGVVPCLLFVVCETFDGCEERRQDEAGGVVDGFVCEQKPEVELDWKKK